MRNFLLKLCVFPFFPLVFSVRAVSLWSRTADSYKRKAHPFKDLTSNTVTLVVGVAASQLDSRCDTVIFSVRYDGCTGPGVAGIG